MPTPAAFITRFFALVLAMAACVAGVNALVDPYLLFDTPRIAGFNDRKPAVATHERQMKEYDAVRRPARTLVLGSSRTDIAFDPLSKAWREEDRPVYNLSLVGSGPALSAHYLRHLLASRPAAERPRTLVIGLDFESFLYRPSALAASGEPAPRPAATSLMVLSDGQPNPDRWLETLRNYAIATVSLDTLLDSLSTVVASARKSGAHMDARGRMEEVAFLEAAAANGIGALFLQKNMETVRQYSSPRQVLGDAREPIRDMAALKDLVAIGRSIDAEIVLFVQPSHADRLELFDRMGYWDDFERWKRALVTLAEVERAQGAKVQVWDFAGYEQFVQETPPARGDRQARLQWFWEPAHYTSALGDTMLARMRGKDGAAIFGSPLTTGNVSQRLQQVRADREVYRNSHAADVRRTRDIFCAAAACKGEGG